MKKNFFAQHLLQWHKTISRPLPWKGSQNPYHIWLSEIILQQTRAEQGLPYYQKFIKQYPTIQQLAQAPLDEVLKLWQGLGYYSRARNLHAAAQMVVQDFKGVFPNKYQNILRLKGVGEYTAAAIASFAFGLPYSVLDGNVYRVLSRFFGIDTPIDTPAGKKQFAALAQELLGSNAPAAYNQAIMDFGAVQCRPALPLCATCPLAAQCTAAQNEQTSDFPVKSKKIEKKERFFYYFVFNCGQQVQMRKRVDKDIWYHLYDFPCIETTENLSLHDLLATPAAQSLLKGVQYSISAASEPFKQTLTHQQIVATFVEIELKQNFFLQDLHFVITERQKIANFALPKIVQRYVERGGAREG